MTQPEVWTCSHFTICNRRGRTQSDLPRLLRSLATEIAALGKDIIILDVTLSNETNEIGPWWEASVYYLRDGWKDEADDEVEPPTAEP